MTRLGLEREIVDRAAYDRTLARFRQAAIRLPTFAELAAPATEAPDADPDAVDVGNLARLHWYNGADRRSLVAVPDHVVLPEALTGVVAPIIVALGNRFPLIRAHKVLAAYACLVPRLVTGQFDPTRHKAIWPSTGNYCRGGVAISRILGCRGVAVLPAGMSAERFDWLASWVRHPEDVIRTPGSESNVKEIYDKCADLARDPTNVVFNQFCEFGNHLAHWSCTGQALERVFEAVRGNSPLQLAAFVSATGSAGTIAAGDHLKERTGCRVTAVEALECPTLLYNGFGEHNIQGIGDKHVPLIHNVMNTDVVVGVSDRGCDALNVLWNDGAGRRWLVDERGMDPDLVEALGDFGLSSICNVLASIKVAKTLGLGAEQAVVTVATDGAEMYRSEAEKTREERFADGFGADEAARVWQQYIGEAGGDHVLVMSEQDRHRIFNLGYFTWVEQQGVSLDDFEARREQGYWQGLRELLAIWDGMIAAFNDATGA